jgi:hypothetical protein
VNLAYLPLVFHEDFVNLLHVDENYLQISMNFRDQFDIFQFLTSFLGFKFCIVVVTVVFVDPFVVSLSSFV